MPSLYFPSISPLSVRRFSATSNSMAMAAMFHHISKSQNYASLCKITTSFSFISTPISKKPFRLPFQVRSVATPAEAVAGFDEMVAGTQRKYYMLGGKGGVGKTSCAASLAVKFANHGHPTIVVSTDPAHSLSDSFDQDLTGGMLVPVDGLDSPLFALEINPEKAREEFRTASQKHGGSGVKDFMDSMGLGMLADQDQMRALDVIRNDLELASLRLIQAPLVDVEIRGVPALKFMGDMVWR